MSLNLQQPDTVIELLCDRLFLVLARACLLKRSDSVTVVGSNVSHV